MKLIQLFFSLLLLSACSTKSAVDQILEHHRSQLGDLSDIQNITTLAACQGPEGAYNTRTESSCTSHYLFFRQDYSFKDNPFYALILTREKGFGLDTTYTSMGPLSKPVIAVLKAHEFHELALQITDRYFQLEKGADTTFFDVSCHQLKAVDHLDYPVRLYFNRDSGLMEGFSQSNPYQKGEVIRVHFKDWRKTDELLLFHQITVLQGKQPYHFNYETIIINDPAFTPLKL